MARRRAVLLGHNRRVARAKTHFNSHSIGIKIPRHRVQDIDTPEDWTRAEILYRVLQEQASE